MLKLSQIDRSKTLMISHFSGACPGKSAILWAVWRLASIRAFSRRQSAQHHAHFVRKKEKLAAQTHKDMVFCLANVTQRILQIPI
jgi:hypothetical protein